MVKVPHPPPFPWQKLRTSSVEMFVILLNNAAPRRRPAEHGWNREGLAEGNKHVFFLGCFIYLFIFFLGLHGRRCEIHFCFGS